MAYNGLSQHVKFEELPAPGDRFVLQDLIGEGTYGEVYSARDTVTGKPLSRASCVLLCFNLTPDKLSALQIILLHSPNYSDVTLIFLFKCLTIDSKMALSV
jgi:myosin-3